MPEVGEMAPDFELKSHLAKDKKVKLSDFRGQNNVVIAFYPLAYAGLNGAGARVRGRPRTFQGL